MKNEKFSFQYHLFDTYGAYLIYIELTIVNNMSYSEQYEIKSL